MSNVFSFRAEFPQDVDRFLGELTKKGISHTSQRFSDSRLPDVEVELYTLAPLRVLLMATKDLPDIHVIQETIKECPLTENPLRRTYEAPEPIKSQTEYNAFGRVMSALIHEGGEQQLQSLGVTPYLATQKGDTVQHRMWLEGVLSVLNTHPGVPGGMQKEQVDFAKSRLGELYSRLTGLSVLEAKRLTLPEKHALNPEPRAFTPEEVTHQLITHFNGMADYWANQHPTDAREAAHGTVFSICAALDGSSMGLPAFDLVPAPCPEDKDYLIGEARNYYVPCLANGRGLHDWVHRPNSIPGLDEKGEALEPYEPEVFYPEPKRGFFEALFQDNFGVIPKRVLFSGPGLGKHRATLALMNEFFSQQTGCQGRGGYVHTFCIPAEEEDFYWDEVENDNSDPVYVGSVYNAQDISIIGDTYRELDISPRRLTVFCKPHFTDSEVTWLTNYFADKTQLLILVSDEANDTLDGPILQY